VRTGWRRIEAGTRGGGTAGHDVHHAWWDAAADVAPPAAPGGIVCVHGLGGSHLDWRRLGPLLVSLGPVRALDLAGFGLTPLGGRTAALGSQTDLLAAYVAAVAPGGPVVLVGNSMGGLVGVLLAARRPDLVAGVVLIGAPLPPAVSLRRAPLVTAHFAATSIPLLGERFLARLAVVPPERRVADTLRLVGVDPASLTDGELAASVALARRRRELPDADLALLQASRSLVRRLTVRARGTARAVCAVTAPVMVVHGSEDRLVPVVTARRAAALRPDWELQVYDGEGHCPQLSAPARLAADVQRWLAAPSTALAS